MPENNLQLLKDKLNLQLDEKTTVDFLDFQKEFCKFNSHTNLISKNDCGVFFEKHIFDSLALNLFLDKNQMNNQSLSLLDIGTGGGFPALPLAFYNKNLQITAIDSVAKKIAFINFIKEKFFLKNLKTQIVRAEELDRGYIEKFDLGTSRALAKLNVLLEYSLPYLKRGGYFIAYKSQSAQQEIDEAQNALEVLGGKIVEIIDYNLPTLTNYERKLIVVEKIKKTPKIYPRGAGTAKKTPL